MKKILLIIMVSLTCLVGRAAEGGDDLLQRANTAYEAGQYPEAIAAYKALGDSLGHSPALYYNLGNSYYKDKQYAQAILQYERALLLDPSDADTQANLELARMHTVDKIESVQPVIFGVWSDALRDTMSCDAWSLWAILMFLAFILCVALYFFAHRSGLRKLGFFGGILLLLLSAMSAYYASEQYEKMTVRDYAIVLAPTVTVRSSPTETGTKLFPLHEGTKVRVRSTLSGWSEIELSDGNVGWIPTPDLEII